MNDFFIVSKLMLDFSSSINSDSLKRTMSDFIENLMNDSIYN